MVHGALACLAILAGSPADTTSKVLDAYRAELAKAGNDGPSQVKLALWCEEHGLSAERSKHLALAVLKEPNNALARGLLGLMADRGKWESPEAVSARRARDEALAARLAEYNRRRDGLSRREESLRVKPPKGRALDPMTEYRLNRQALVKLAPDHVRLGLWCESNGLKAEALAHFTQAVVLDPYRDSTWARMGFVRLDGRWVSRDDASAARLERDAQKRADRYWEPLLKKWRDMLAGKDTVARDTAEAEIESIADVRAVPMVRKVLAGGTEDQEHLAVRVIGRIEGEASSKALAWMAMFSRSHAVRTAAIETLRRREPREYVGPVVDSIRTPLRYRVEPVGGPGAPGALLVETPRFLMLRSYDAPAVWQPSHQFHGWAGIDPNGLPVVVRGAEMKTLARELQFNESGYPIPSKKLLEIEQRTARLIAEANLKAASSQQRLIADVNEIEAANEAVVALNERAAALLRGAAEAPAELANDQDAWQSWWFDKLGQKYTVPRAVEKPMVAIDASPQYPAPVVFSCFVAGTPVRTIDGRKPIETLRVGDQVLTQDPASGALSYQPVVVVHRNPPAETLALGFDNGERLTASVYHRFWRVGRGWAMARELATGDVVRTLGGPTRVSSVEPGPTALLFNLDVDKTRTFFVGGKDVLVHDNRLPDPRLRPFDNPDAIAATGKAATSKH